jgi:hypothetical protein
MEYKFGFNFCINTTTIKTTTKDGGGETTKRGTGMATMREQEKRQTQTYLGGGD